MTRHYWKKITFKLELEIDWSEELYCHWQKTFICNPRYHPSSSTTGRDGEEWGLGFWHLQFTREIYDGDNGFIQRQEIYLIPLKWQYIAMVFKEYDQVSRISRSCEYHILQRYLLNCVSIPVYYYNPSVGSPGGTWSLPGWCSWCGVIRPAAATPHSATLLSHITLKEGDSVSLPQAASQTQCNL